VARTFGEIVREVRLTVPLAPALLVESWVRNAYKRLCDARNWSFLRSEGEFVINASKSGTAILTQGSATVTGGTLTFAATDVGRQFRAPTPGPPITITAVSTAGPTSCTLERAWQDPVIVGTQTCRIGDEYAVCPADFGHFLAVIDPRNQRLIRIFMTDQEINIMDPGRYNTAEPWALATYRRSALTATAGRAQYEWWPRWEGTPALRFPYYYIRRPAELSDDAEFEGPVRDREDAVLEGALAKAATWPGTAQQRNPYFSLGLAAQHKQNFDAEVGMLEVKDEELYLTWLIDNEWSTYFTKGGHRPVDAAYLQSHE
jgi:hypothetical protein